jgi:hypothetical protein
MYQYELRTYSPSYGIPPGPRLVANMVKPKEMHDHAIPVIVIQFIRNVSCHIIVYFSKILVWFLVLLVSNVDLPI